MNDVKGVFLKEKEKFEVKGECIFLAFRTQAGRPASHEIPGKGQAWPLSSTLTSFGV